jgi:hypothetical protein
MHSLLTGRGRSSLPAIVLALAIKGIKLSGFVAWITWLAVHRFYLVGFQDRLLVLIHWSIRFATRVRRARLIANPASAEAATAPGGASRARNHVADASKRGLPPLADAMTGARKLPVVFVVPGANAADEFCHPFRYAP